MIERIPQNTKYAPIKMSASNRSKRAQGTNFPARNPALKMENSLTKMLKGGIPGTLGWSADTDPPNLDGPWNLGVLFATGLVPNPRVFYCPGTARISTTSFNGYAFGYDYSAAVSNTWPSTSIDSGDDKIRTGYNYFPQGRKRVYIDGNHIGPAAGSGTCPGNNCTPLRQNDIDPNKSIATDLFRNIDYWSHLASGSVAGLNALFPDGRVVFQNARSNPQAFDPLLWKSSSDTDYIGNNPVNFRIVMSLWHP